MVGVVESIGLLGVAEGVGAGSGLIQPIVTVCLKCGVQQGESRTHPSSCPCVKERRKALGLKLKE